MKFFKICKDGGPKSNVTAFVLVEIKWLFSICFLKFNKGGRENFHSHAFNALTWWLKGSIVEYHKDNTTSKWGPSLVPKYTPRSCFHRYMPDEDVYALTIRGPWSKQWFEYNRASKTLFTLENGRKIVKVEPSL